MLKYIVIPHGDFEAMITFPGTIKHTEMALNLNISRDNIKSAGFIDKNLNCHGNSHSLDINSREEIDTDLFKSNLGII